MQCSLSFIQNSNLSKEDKERFEDMVQSQTFTTVKEMVDYENGVKAQFFTNGFFEDHPELNMSTFTYNNISYPYQIVNGEVISSAPTDIERYISNHYNQVKPDSVTIKDARITPQDRIIFGHPGIGKSFLRETREDFIDVDEDYKEEHTMQKILRSNAKNTGKKEDLQEWEDYVTEWWNRVKKDAQRSGKRILVSNLPILRMFPQDFDKVLTMTQETFIERAKQRNDYEQGETEDWKNSLDEAISKIPFDKVFTTDKYLSELLPRDQISKSSSRNPNLTEEEKLTKLIANLDNHVGFDITELQPLVDLLLEINPDFNIEYVNDLLEKNGVFAYADIKNFKAVLGGYLTKAYVAEEFCHLLLEAYVDKPFLREIEARLPHTLIYQQLVGKYKQDKDYYKDGILQTNKIKREILGKILGDVIAGRNLDEVLGTHKETKGLKGMLQRLWQEIKDLFSGKLSTKIMRVVEDISEKRGFNIDSVQEFNDGIFLSLHGLDTFDFLGMRISLADYSKENPVIIDMEMLVDSEGKLNKVGQALSYFITETNKIDNQKDILQRILIYEGSVARGVNHIQLKTLSGVSKINFNTAQALAAQFVSDKALEFEIDGVIETNGVYPVPNLNFDDYKANLTDTITTIKNRTVGVNSSKAQVTTAYGSSVMTQKIKALEEKIRNFATKFETGNIRKIIDKKTTFNYNEIRTLKDLQNYTDKEKAALQFYNFINSLHTFYEGLSDIVDKDFITRMFTNADGSMRKNVDDSLVINSLKDHKDLAIYAKEILTTMISDLQFIQSSEGIRSQDFQKVISDTLGYIDSFTVLAENMITDRVAGIIATAIQPSNEHFKNEIKRITNDKSEEEWTPEMKNNIEALKKAIIEISGDDLSNRQKVVEAIKLSMINGDKGLTGFQRAFDGAVLGYKSSLDWLIQAIALHTSTESSKTAFESLENASEINNIENEILQIGVYNVGKRLLVEHEYLYHGKIVKGAFFASATQADVNALAIMEHNLGLMEKEALLDPTNDKLEADIQKERFTIRMFKKRNFYSEVSDNTWNSEMAMYEELKKILVPGKTLTDEELDEYLYEEILDSRELYKDINAHKQSVGQYVNSTEAERLHQRKQYKEARKRFIINRKSPTNERVATIRKMKSEYNKQFKEKKQNINYWFNDLRPIINRLPDNERVIIEHKMSGVENGISENDVILDIQSYIKNVLPFKNLQLNHKDVLNNLTTFIDHTVYVIGNQKWHERRLNLIGRISVKSASLEPTQYYTIDDPDDIGTIEINDVNGDPITVTYIDGEEYDDLDEYEKKKYEYKTVSVKTFDGTYKTFLMNIRRNNIVPKNHDITQNWSLILDITEPYREESGEIYLDPTDPEQLSIRQEVIRLEKEIETLKENTKSSRDTEPSNYEKEIRKSRMLEIQMLGKLQDDFTTMSYLEEAYDIVRNDTGGSFQNIRNNQFRNFQYAFKNKLHNKDFLKSLYEMTQNEIDALEEGSIEKWIIENHIVTMYETTDKDGDIVQNYNIKPAYFFRRLLPSNVNDRVANLHDTYSFNGYKKEHVLPYAEQRSRYDVTNRNFNSRGLNPDKEWVAIQKDNSLDGEALKKIYDVVVEKIHIGQQKKSINTSGKIGYRAPSMEKYYSEGNLLHTVKQHGRNIIGTRQQFEEGNMSTAEIEEVAQESKQNWFVKAYQNLIQFMSSITSSNEELIDVGNPERLFNKIPVFYSLHKDPSEITNDVVSSVLGYTESLNASNSIIKNIPLVSSASELLNRSKSVHNKWRANKLNNLIDLEFKNNNGSVNSFINKLFHSVSSMLRFVSQSNFALATAIKNPISNIVQNIATNDKHLVPNVSPFKRAMGNYVKIVSNTMKYKTEDKDTLLYKALNPGDAKFHERFKRPNEIAEFVASGDIFISIMTSAEKLDSLVDLYRIVDVNVKKANGEDISIYDAFQVVNGKLELEQGLKDVEGNVFDMKALLRLTHQVKQNKLNRTGHSDETTVLSSTQIGRSLMTMSSFLIPVLKNQLINANKGYRVDIVQGEIRRSLTRDFWHVILKSFPLFGGKFSYWKTTATQGEKRSFIQLSTFIITTTLIHLILKGMGYNGYDDDDDKYSEIDSNTDIENFLILVLTKVNSEQESSFITVNPNWFPSIFIDQRLNTPRDFVPIFTENKSIIQKNMLTNFFTRDLTDLVFGITGTVHDQDSPIGRYEKGDYKSLTVLKKHAFFWNRFDEQYNHAGESLKIQENLDRLNK